MNNQVKQIAILVILFLSAYFIFSFFNPEEEVELFNAEGKFVQSADKYFAGKTIEWIIPFKEGGGSDTWARFNAPFFRKHISGNPIIIVNNLPGGGSIKGANLFASRVKPDCLMILGTSGTTQIPFLLDDPRVKYDYANYKPLMTFPTGGVVYCSSKLGVKSAADLVKIKNKSLKYASQGPTSLDILPMFSFDLLGLDIEAVFGFKGRGAGRLAFERGEVLIDYQTSSAYLKNVLPLVQRGEAIPLFSFGVLDKDGNVVRDSNFPNIPHFGEVYQAMGGKLEGIKWNTWLAFMSAGFGGMKLLLTPKETPDELVKEFQKAIIAMKEDPDYKAKKEAAIGSYDQSIGEEADKIFKLATEVGKEEKEYMKNWLREQYDVNL